LRLELDLASEGEEVTRLINHGCQLTLLSYDFSHNISVGLFHEKNCCNCINLFPYIFVGFICNGFSIKWLRFDQDICRSHEKHMQEGEQLGQVSSLVQLVQEVNLRLRFTPVTSHPRSSRLFLKIVTFHIPITHTIYILITHRNCEESIERKTSRKVSTTQPPY